MSRLVGVKGTKTCSLHHRLRKGGKGGKGLYALRSIYKITYKDTRMNNLAPLLPKFVWHVEEIAVRNQCEVRGKSSDC